jgi:hypothetical protein
MSGEIYERVIGADGKPTFVVVDSNGLSAYLQARAKESSTHMGSMIGALIGPELIGYVKAAVVAFAAGDYVGLAVNGGLAALGVFGVLASILLPEQKGVVAPGNGAAAVGAPVPTTLVN